MWYYRAKLWFSVQVLLYNLCWTLPILALGDFMYTTVCFLSIGFMFALLTVSFFHRQERFVMLNLGISPSSLILFSWLFQLLFLLFVGLIIVAVSATYGL